MFISETGCTCHPPHNTNASHMRFSSVAFNSVTPIALLQLKAHVHLQSVGFTSYPSKC